MDAKNVTIGELTAQIAAEAKRLGYSEASIWRYWMPKMGMIAKYYREQGLCVYDPAITEAFLQGIERRCETGEVSGNYLRQLRQIARRVNEFYLTGTLRIDATRQGTKEVGLVDEQNAAFCTLHHVLDFNRIGGCSFNVFVVILKVYV